MSSSTGGTPKGNRDGLLSKKSEALKPIEEPGCENNTSSQLDNEPASKDSEDEAIAEDEDENDAAARTSCKLRVGAKRKAFVGHQQFYKRSKEKETLCVKNILEKGKGNIFEGKHRDLKIQARNNFSRKNVCYSLAERHQLTQSQRFASQKGFERRLTCGPGINSKLSDYPDYDSFKDHLPENIDVTPFRPTWAKIYGILYRKKMIVTMTREREKLLFGEIKHIFLNSSSDVFFVLLRIEALEFCDHIHAFRIEKTSGPHCFINQKDLWSPVPQNRHIRSDGEHYVLCR